MAAAMLGQPTSKAECQVAFNGILGRNDIIDHMRKMMLAFIRQSSIIVTMSTVAILTPIILKGQEDNTSRLNIESDVDILKRVIVLEPGDEIRRITVLANEDYPSLPGDAMQIGATWQHKKLVGLLEAEGVEVLDFVDLLDSAILAARKQGKWQEWLRSTFHESPVLWENADLIDATDLIGRGEYFYHFDQNGTLSPLLLPLKWMF